MFLVSSVGSMAIYMIRDLFRLIVGRGDRGQLTAPRAQATPMVDGAPSATYLRDSLSVHLRRLRLGLLLSLASIAIFGCYILARALPSFGILLAVVAFLIAVSNDRLRRLLVGPGFIRTSIDTIISALAVVVLLIPS